MYYRFNYYSEAKLFLDSAPVRTNGLDSAPKSKLVCWSYGSEKKPKEFVVFIPKEI